jgi:S1-C subfamily serine protease
MSLALRLSLILGASFLLISRVAVAQAPAHDLAKLVASVRPAVVYVVVATDSGAQSGSGFVLRSDANTSTIVTANHVIEGETQVDVIFDSNEHERYPAQIVMRDHRRDVAILKVPAGHRHTLSLESARDTQEGTAIIVMGYPRVTLEFERIAGDDLRPTVHSGIVSAVRFNGEVIQFDALTDHGDSGGPIIDEATGRVVAIVHGAPLDPSYAARGLEQELPGSTYGPSASTVEAVLSGAPSTASIAAGTSGAETSAGRSGAVVGSSSIFSRAGANSASYRVGYGVPQSYTTEGSTDSSNSINEAVDASVLQRLQAYLQQENSLYLIPLKLSSEALSDSQHLSGYCDDSRVNALAIPAFAWNLTGGPRYNGYGVLVGYSGEAAVKIDFFVFDCFGMPFFAEQKTKTENRYFAHRQPDREIVDMANDLLDQVTSDFSVAKTQRAAAWNNLLKTGLSIDPSDRSYHSMMYFTKKPEGYQVLIVVANGPADQAGIKQKDIIEQVNGVDAASLSIDGLREQMNRPTYTVAVQRPGGTETITVHPSQYAELVRLLQH